MKSVFAVIIDDNFRYLVGRRYDTDQSYYFMGGTYYPEDGTKLDVVKQKVIEKSSFVLSIESTNDPYTFYLSDGKRKIKMVSEDYFENRDQIYYVFFALESFDKYIRDWQEDFEENQIRLVNIVIQKIRKIASNISFVEWINLMVLYRGRYRSSRSFVEILRKRRLTNDEIEDITAYLEVLDAYLRYQNLSLVERRDLRSLDGLADSQRDFFEMEERRYLK